MKCYKCGCTLTEHEFCTNCGVDVSLYKRLIGISNFFYNEGLEKARVRDLSGAIVSLRECLKLNKNCVQARNLLGLIYFEIGEPVSALVEWVISKNLKTKKNIADDYINLIQSNTSRLEMIDQTVKKFNQALEYCRQGDNDLAIIQLKKVVSLNSNYVKAYQLLALLYINEERWQEALDILKRCLAIDINNTLALKCQKEALHMLQEDDLDIKSNKKRIFKREEDTPVEYISGNEVIIRPGHIKEGRKITSLVPLLIGILIGFLATFFLVLPAQVQRAKADIDKDIKVVNEQLDAKTAIITEQDLRLKTLMTDNDSLKDRVNSYTGSGGMIGNVENILAAMEVYMDKPTDTEVIAGFLDNVDSSKFEEGTPEVIIRTYDRLVEAVGPAVGATYFEKGMEAYQRDDFEEALLNLEKAFHYDETNGEALFNLANSYRRMDNKDRSIETYTRVIELFPGTEKATRSQTYINELTGQE